MAVFATGEGSGDEVGERETGAEEEEEGREERGFVETAEILAVFKGGSAVLAEAEAEREAEEAHCDESTDEEARAEGEEGR